MESDIDKEEINSEIEPEDLQQKLDDGWKLVDVERMTSGCTGIIRKLNI